MSQQLYNNLYNLTESILQQVLELYDGKVVGSEENDFGIVDETFLPDGKSGCSIAGLLVSKDRPLSDINTISKLIRHNLTVRWMVQFQRVKIFSKYVAYVASKWKRFQ